MSMWAEILNLHGIIYLWLYLYTGGIMWTLWYITVSWLVHMCKQDIGMWKVITRTYQGSWSRRGELCYQLHTAIPMTQPSFWGYQIFMKKWELHISAKFEQNSQNKESAYQIYKVCICHYAYVWNVKRSYGVFWLYLDSVDKVGFALKTPFLILHTCVAHDLRRTLANFGTKVKFKLGAWTLHYFSTHNPSSFVKRWWYFTHVANDLKRTPFHCWVRDKRSRSNLDI